MVLTLGRSGSNALTDTLNQHPAILNLGEVLGEWNSIRKVQRRLRILKGDDRYLDEILYGSTIWRVANLARSASKVRKREFSAIKPARNIQNVGIKEFSLNLRNFGQLDYLSSRNDIKVIGLKRTNVADRMLSSAMLSHTGVVLNKVDDAQTARTIRLDSTDIERRLRVVEQENKELDDLLSSVPKENVYEIAYQDFFANEDRRVQIMSEVFEFLGVAPFETSMRMRKLIQTPISETIENFDECRVALKGSPYEKYFLQG